MSVFIDYKECYQSTRTFLRPTVDIYRWLLFPKLKLFTIYLLQPPMLCVKWIISGSKLLLLQIWASRFHNATYDTIREIFAEVCLCILIGESSRPKIDKTKWNINMIINSCEQSRNMMLSVIHWVTKDHVFQAQKWDK